MTGLGAVWSCGDEPLKDGGLELEVTEADKSEYVLACARFKLVERDADVLNAMRLGFLSVIPSNLMVELQSARTLREILIGSPEIDVDDWEMNTLYSGKATKKHPIVVKFWEIVRAMSEEERRKVRKKKEHVRQPVFIFFWGEKASSVHNGLSSCAKRRVLQPAGKQVYNHFD